MSYTAQEDEPENRKNYLFKSAAQKNVDALYRVGSAYTTKHSTDFGLSPDKEKEEAFLKGSARNGPERAKFILSTQPYLSGERKDFKVAINNAVKLQKKGNEEADKFIKGILGTTSYDLKENFDIGDNELEYLQKKIGWEYEKF